MEVRDTSRLLSGHYVGLPVLRTPDSARRASSGADEEPLFDLLVGVPRDQPEQVWRLIVDDLEYPYFGTGFRLIRVSPEERSADAVYGWMGLDRASIGMAITCDHRTVPHRARVLDLAAAGLDDMPRLFEMIAEGWDEPSADEADAFFSSRLGPLALAIVEIFLAGGDDEPVKVPPFSLLPPGPEWQPKSTEDELIPMFWGVQDGEYQEWMPFEVDIEDMRADHGRFRVQDWGDIPGMTSVSKGWAAWPDGTILAWSRDDNYEDVPASIWRVAMPGFDVPQPGDKGWQLAFKRALVFASLGCRWEWE